MATGTGKTYQGIDYSETRVYENKMERVSENCPA